MSETLSISLANNVALLLALGIVYEITYTIPARFKKTQSIISGMLIAGICLLVMTLPVKFMPGITYDTRSVLISVTAMVFGAIPALITVAAALIYRIMIGGIGVYAGSAVIVTSALIGLGWRHLIMPHLKQTRWISIYLAGIVVHVVMLACQMLIPYPHNIAIIERIAFPVMVIYPIGTLLLSLLLIHQIERTEVLKAKVQTEKTLLESEDRFRKVVEGAPDAILIESNERIVYVNQAALNLFGAEREDELLDTSVFDRIDPSIHEQIRQRIRRINEENESMPALEDTFLRIDGSPVQVEVSAVSIRYAEQQGILVFCRDITERKQLELEKQRAESQTRQHQKFEAIGTLAGGVASEIVQPIHEITNQIQSLLAETDPVSPQTTRLRGILAVSNQVARIVQDLLIYARQEKQIFHYARVEALIESTLALIRNVMSEEQIEMHVDIPSYLPPIKCRSQQIQQVLMCLLNNARDTLNEKYPGAHPDKVIQLRCKPYVHEGRQWIMIRVQDHGNGISEANRDKIFEPFYSTRSPEEWAGLGLSISYGIVKDHQGHIEVQTDFGQSTTIDVHLPIDGGQNKRSVVID